MSEEKAHPPRFKQNDTSVSKHRNLLICVPPNTAYPYSSSPRELHGAARLIEQRHDPGMTLTSNLDVGLCLRNSLGNVGSAIQSDWTGKTTYNDVSLAKNTSYIPPKCVTLLQSWSYTTGNEWCIRKVRAMPRSLHPTHQQLIVMLAKQSLSPRLWPGQR